MECVGSRPGRNGLVAALALVLLAVPGCSAARPPATAPDARPEPDTRAHARPAERLDGGGAAPSARGRPPADSGFERGLVREESVADTSSAEAENREDAAENASGDETGEVQGDLRHVLQSGQTLYSVSRMYGVTLEALERANGIHDARKVAAGTPLVIPLPSRAQHPGNHPAPVARQAKHATLRWPIEGTITGAFGLRGQHHHHEGIDIDGSDGDPIEAAASGTVVLAGSNGDYGRTVIIDHGNGMRTLYGHASRLLVKEGDEVHTGDAIAAVGHSGNARGSHLHFEVRLDGRPVNPLPYLLPADVLSAGAVSLPPHTTKTATRRR
jgi:LysM repeat protein